ncbi:PilZ domain-containing protein [Paenibacillus oralis]|uniref:PilZ domain-containing protein n=1 Tax=Paenibacillus oralis TaxID=2490856 RepID=A0A3P3U9K7_9BACL|nr:PilZ domain-containing protein [Paenibacillus oralis]RRJ66980.1 PilZ domain-containing protein [Paenibacillus oralis]
MNIGDGDGFAYLKNLRIERKKAQNRHFYRVALEIELKLRTKPVDHAAGEDKQLVLTTLDISGGGLSFLCPDPLEPEEEVQGSIYLKTSIYQKHIPFTGKIISCVKHSDQKYRIALRFVEIKDSFRSDIIRFCLYKQTEMRNKFKNYPI